MKRKLSGKGNLKLFIILIVMTFAIYMLFQVWLKVKIQLIAGEIEQLKRETLKLREENNQFEARVIDLSSYQRITRIAQKELGMIFLEQEVLIQPDKKNSSVR